MAANTYGRQVVESLVNKTGGAVAAGDVVIIDTANDGAFTTTTTARSEVTIGVVQETIASNATGRVLLSGYAALVNVPASVTRGHYVETHTVAKQATGNSTRRSGSFGQFRTGGTTPTAVLWGNADPTAIAGTALVSASYNRTSGNYTTASTTFVDVDGTNLSFTLTTGAHRVLLGFTGSISNDGTNSSVDFDVTVDGTRQGATTHGLQRIQVYLATAVVAASFTYLTAQLTAGSHTFKLQWKVSGNNGTLQGSDPAAHFYAVELPA